MTFSPTQFYLASRSPRRVELLSQLAYTFETLSVDVCEQVKDGENPIEFVKRIAAEKAQAGFDQIKNKSLPVLGADTIVYCKGQIMGKPRDQDEAMQMLTALSDATHRVYTAVAVCSALACRVVLSENDVSMRKISTAEMAKYWLTGEPLDKAGAYAIQGLAAVFISNIRGSYSGIMGLPLFETAELLRGYDIVSPMHADCQKS